MLQQNTVLFGEKWKNNDRRVQKHRPNGRKERPFGGCS